MKKRKAELVESLYSRNDKPSISFQQYLDPLEDDSIIKEENHNANHIVKEIKEKEQEGSVGIDQFLL